MNRRTIVPSEEMRQHHYPGTIPAQPFSYANQQPILPRKSIQHDTDVITHTRSFQMLEGWISDSEKSTPSDAQSANKTTAVQQNASSRRFSAGAPSSHPSRSFRYLQEQYATDTDAVTTKEMVGLRRSSDVPRPYQTLKYDTSEQLPVTRSEAVNNREDLAEIYNKPPPSFREREPEARRFSGSRNPSRAFRFLQKMTQDDQQNDATPVPGYIKPQQLISQSNQAQSSIDTSSKSTAMNENDF
ncbi:unnamed protein product [Adineta ricciae]|uniref:Uncharacterized protein n=1 Tax=Adineta ricciae TaxID=249248 RepID=A0A815FYV9_ADIRI|nr:unnamed protein product [Adineta ricciae]